MDRHVLRGETSEAHVLTWDRLKVPNPDSVGLEARGLTLNIRAGDESWQVELPPDVDIQGASAVLKQSGPLQLTCPKKKHNDSQEQLHQLKAEALASNKLAVIPVELEVS
uniref:PIH1D1/2/3 CS-like domain-containing protein n=1 Tax=Dunaliella tertiolecta TaxID=3047 RepID=A0A7S3R918_DUNTE|mmetsp:Transcript_6768/g.18163  ORF Transcript_6768/g.18163 Transcript_6768/m.18163 type:complete len:110 (+) Transcript_6768:78-407(+)|eukprot:CAMPEP_0202358288 /NCGR_PEP_ID=MMETSP1126-20121109/12008_1 /ASSEMBLY_ACC=CAM_ASM_000457 /TAXON_ID=3047 /ORGANISM="Dunaliella tertiolecta, Strain CCMP1320" /LENGTH=109 /DNA_ID=CAMNT_0048951405 /DNA_START=36 /DNA_END=365 /DNA_ORIENTATION=+